MMRTVSPKLRMLHSRSVYSRRNTHKILQLARSFDLTDCSTGRSNISGSSSAESHRLRRRRAQPAHCLRHVLHLFEIFPSSLSGYRASNRKDRLHPHHRHHLVYLRCPKRHRAWAQAWLLVDALQSRLSCPKLMSQGHQRRGGRHATCYSSCYHGVHRRLLAS